MRMFNVYGSVCKDAGARGETEKMMGYVKDAGVCER